MKEELRKKYKSVRDNIPPHYRHHASLEVCKSFIQYFESLKLEGESKTVLCYVNFRSEVETDHILSFLWESKQRVCVPKCDIQNKNIEIFKIESHEDLEIGAYSIFEPRHGLSSSQKIEAAEVDIVVVPGLVFDSSGARIGYGGGYYDRFLAATRPDCIKIALCYNLQLTEFIRVNEYDIGMDEIITEKKIVHCNSNKG